MSELIDVDRELLKYMKATGYSALLAQWNDFFQWIKFLEKCNRCFYYGIEKKCASKTMSARTNKYRVAYMYYDVGEAASPTFIGECMDT